MSKLILCGGGKPIIEIVKSTKMSIVGVYTHPDNDKLIQICNERCIPWTMKSINDKALPIKPIYIASIYYKHIIKQRIIDAVYGKIFNAHAALLPRHRGRSAVPWAIVEGDTCSGVTYHYINKGIDTGPIIMQAVCQIAPNETQTSLFEKVDRLVVKLFTPALHLVMTGFEGIVQQGQANYNSGVPYGGVINRAWDGDKVERFIRAMYYPPKAPAMFNNKPIRNMEDYLNERYDSNSYSGRGRISQPISTTN